MRIHWQEAINENILNISSISDNFKNEILKKTNINIKIFHPKIDKNITCSGKLTDTKYWLKKGPFNWAFFLFY